MAHAHLRQGAREALREPFGDVHRAVLAAGAADRDREVTARAFAVDGNTRLQETRHVIDVRTHGGVLLPKGDDGRIKARGWTERLVPRRRGVRGGIEDEVGIPGEA